MISSIIKVQSKKNSPADFYKYISRYVSDGGRAPSMWIGEGAKHLGLDGKVLEKELLNLVDGKSPDGLIQLIKQRDDADVSRTFTLSPPKSFSAIVALADDETSAKFLDAHKRVTIKACEYALTMCFGQQGVNGKTKVNTDALMCSFTHFTSRAGDFQIHEHVLTLLMGLREDEKWQKVVTDAMFNNRVAIGQIYQNELAMEVKAMGFEIDEEILEDGKAFKIVGITDEICDKASKRSKEIDAYIEKKGWQNTHENRMLAAEQSRKAKEKDGSFEDEFEDELSSLRKRWIEEYKNEGIDWDGMKRNILETMPQEKIVYDREEAIQHFNDKFVKGDDTNTGKGSRCSKHDLIQAIAEKSLGQLTADQIFNEANEIIELSGKIVKLGKNENGSQRITSKELVDKEYNCLRFAVKSKTDVSHVIPTECIDLALKIIEERNQKNQIQKAKAEGKIVNDWELFRWNKEQIAAVRFIAENPGALKIVRGVAGSGKSTILEALVMASKMYEPETEFVACAVASVAADNLEEIGAKRVENLAKLNTLLEKKRMFLNKKSVVLLDEGGMVDTFAYATLVKHVERAGAKIVICGDQEQLQAIGAGGIHKLLHDKVGCATLNNAIRQYDKKDAEASLGIVSKKGKEAIEYYKQKDEFKVAKDFDTAREMIAEKLVNSKYEWSKKGCSVDSRSVGRELSNLIKAKRVEKGEIKNGVDVKISDPNDKKLVKPVYLQNFSEGDYISFLSISKSIGEKEVEMKVMNDNGNVKTKTSKINNSPIRLKEPKLIEKEWEFKNSTGKNIYYDNNSSVKTGQKAEITNIKDLGNGVAEITAKMLKGDKTEIVFRTDEYNSFCLSYASNTSHKSQGASYELNCALSLKTNKHKFYVDATRHKAEFFCVTTEDAYGQFEKDTTKEEYNKAALEVLEDEHNKLLEESRNSRKTECDKNDDQDFKNNFDSIIDTEYLNKINSLLASQSIQESELLPQATIKNKPREKEISKEELAKLEEEVKGLEIVKRQISMKVKFLEQKNTTLINAICENNFDLIQEEISLNNYKDINKSHLDYVSVFFGKKAHNHLYDLIEKQKDIETSIQERPQLKPAQDKYEELDSARKQLNIEYENEKRNAVESIDKQINIQESLFKIMYLNAHFDKTVLLEIIESNVDITKIAKEMRRYDNAISDSEGFNKLNKFKTDVKDALKQPSVKNVYRHIDF